MEDKHMIITSTPLKKKEWQKKGRERDRAMLISFADSTALHDNPVFRSNVKNS